MPGLSDMAAPDTQGDLRVVVQLARLGDFLQTTPLLACLRRDYPDDQLAVAITEAQVPLAKACGLAHELLVCDPGALKRLADEPEATPAVKRAVARDLLAPLWDKRPRQVYQLNFNPLSAAIAAGWPEARVHGWQLAGDVLRGEAWAPFVYAMATDRRLTRLHLCDLWASYADPADPPPSELVYQVDVGSRESTAELLADKGGPLVVLQLGANNDLRRWPTARYAALAKGLCQAGCRVAVVGSQHEQPLGGSMLQAMDTAKAEVIDLMGRTSLSSLAAVLKAADLVISGDTGTLHLACAVGANTLGLYMGPAQVHETGPYAPGHLVLQARDDCGPCYEQNPPCKGAAQCRELIQADAVLAAAQDLLAGKNAAQASEGLALPQGVDALEAVADEFGVHYRPLIKRPLSVEQALALALREAGRVLLRSAYEPDQAAATEMAHDFGPPSRKDAQAMAGLASAAAKLSAALEGQDHGAVQAALEQAPELKPLAAAEHAPRVVRACTVAAEVLSRAADLAR